MGYDQQGGHGSMEAAHAAVGINAGHATHAHAHQAKGGDPINIGGRGRTNRDWWPNSLNLTVLRQNSELSNPLGSDFDYRQAFSTLNYTELKADIAKVLTESQDWWPADYGNYGPLFIRMAWHSTATEHNVHNSTTKTK